MTFADWIVTKGYNASHTCAEWAMMHEAWDEAQKQVSDPLARFIADKLKQHTDNLRLWENGFLALTEPSREERFAIMRELKSAIMTLHEIRVLLPRSEAQR